MTDTNPQAGQQPQKKEKEPLALVQSKIMRVRVVPTDDTPPKYKIFQGSSVVCEASFETLEPALDYLATLANPLWWQDDSARCQGGEKGTPVEPAADGHRGPGDVLPRVSLLAKIECMERDSDTAMAGQTTMLYKSDDSRQSFKYYVDAHGTWLGFCDLAAAIDYATVLTRNCELHWKPAR